MNDCGTIQPQLSLYLYGELSFDQEEQVDAHLATCADCRQALERERSLHNAFDLASAEPPASVLWENRHLLSERLREERAPQATLGWWDRLVDSLRPTPAHFWKPAGALALVTLGFLSGQFAPWRVTPAAEAPVNEAGVSRVRNVQTSEDGRVHIMLDETKERTISGDLDDAQIQSLLLAAAKEPSDPGLRAETLNILNNRVSTPEVRSALLYALGHDENAGVRLRALEGLRSYSHDRQVQNALAQAMLNDNNPGVRTQAVDLLTSDLDVNFDRGIVGAMQQMLLQESNGYVRQRGQRLLQAVNASAEIY